MTSTHTHPSRGTSVPRTTVQLATAAVITAPAALHALRGTGSPWSVLLVFVLALSAIWILSAVAIAASGWFDRVVPARSPASSAPASTTAAAAPSADRGQALGRIAVAQVPADQAVHADEDGRVTAATTGEMR